MANNSALNTHSEKLRKMLKATESVQKINEARQAEEEDITDADPLKRWPTGNGRGHSSHE